MSMILNKVTPLILVFLYFQAVVAADRLPIFMHGDQVGSFEHEVYKTKNGYSINSKMNVSTKELVKSKIPNWLPKDRIVSMVMPGAALKKNFRVEVSGQLDENFKIVQLKIANDREQIELIDRGGYYEKKTTSESFDFPEVKKTAPGEKPAPVPKAIVQKHESTAKIKYSEKAVSVRSLPSYLFFYNEEIKSRPSLELPLYDERTAELVNGKIIYLGKATSKSNRHQPIDKFEVRAPYGIIFSIYEDGSIDSIEDTKDFYQVRQP